MRKDVLVSLITDYEEKISLEKFYRWFNDEIDRFQALKKFMQSESILLLNDNDDISITDFIHYFFSTCDNQEKIKEFFSSSFLESKKPLAKLFNKLLEDRKPSNTFGDVLDILPVEILYYVAAHLNGKDICYLSQASSAFYNLTRHIEFWRQKLIAAGCCRFLLSRLVEIDVVLDYRALYKAYMCFPHKKHPISHLWQLLCLSGHPKAIAYALTLENVNIHTVSEEGFNFLHYALCSGSNSAIEYVLYRGISPKCLVKPLSFIYERYNIANLNLMHVAALLGSVTALKAAREICRKFKINASKKIYIEKSPWHYTVVDLAFLSGNMPAIKYVVDMLDQSFLPQIDFHEVLDIHFWAMLSGNVAAIKYAIELRREYNHPTIGIEMDDSTILHKAALSGSVSAIDYALRLCKRKGIRPAFLTTANENILHFAVLSGRVSAIERVFKICEEFHIDPASLNIRGENIFHLAVFARSVAAVRFVRKKCIELDLNISPDMTDNAGHDAFYYARGNEAMLNALEVSALKFAVVK